MYTSVTLPWPLVIKAGDIKIVGMLWSKCRDLKLKFSPNGVEKKVSPSLSPSL